MRAAMRRRTTVSRALSHFLSLSLYIYIYIYIYRSLSLSLSLSRALSLSLSGDYRKTKRAAMRRRTTFGLHKV